MPLRERQIYALLTCSRPWKKATFQIVTTCDKLLAVKSHIKMVTDSIDAIAPVGPVVSEISSIRRQQLRPSLKQEFQTAYHHHQNFCLVTILPSKFMMQKRWAALAKQLPLIQNMTAPEAIGAKTLIKLVDMTKATKAAHERLFGGKDTAQRGGKNCTTATRTRPKSNNDLPWTTEIGSKWFSAIRRVLPEKLSTLSWWHLYGRMHRAFLTGLAYNYIR